MTMCAKVLRVENDCLCVCDKNTNQEVIVHTCRANCFCEGDCVCIHFSGAMTMSIPPQISATCIFRVRHCR